jgi:NADH-quinone oxidoreductase subunit M
MTDATTKERWVIAPVIALIVVLGVFPHPLLERISPSVQQLIEHVAPGGVNK